MENLDHDERRQITRRTRRRYLFAVHAVFSLMLITGLSLVGFTHWNNDVLVDGVQLFIGFANPYPLFAAIGFAALIGMHGLWLRRAEQRDRMSGIETLPRYLTRYRLIFGWHLVWVVAAILTLLTVLDSQSFTESYKYYGTTGPHYPDHPLILELFLLSPLVILTVVPHALWWGYQELLARNLRHAVTKHKPKNAVEPTLTLGDDGELFYEDEVQYVEQNR